ncbi:hypothetical protein ABK040_000907 [Willaertia magna]
MRFIPTTKLNKRFMKTIIYTATFTFIGINFTTLSHYLRYNYYDINKQSPKPINGEYYKNPENILGGAELFYTLNQSFSTNTNNNNEQQLVEQDEKNTTTINNEKNKKNTTSIVNKNDEKNNERIKLIVFIPDIALTREVFQPIENEILNNLSSNITNKEMNKNEMIYSLRFDKYGYGYSNIVNEPRHLHNNVIELHTLLEHVIQNKILKNYENIPNIDILFIAHGYGTLLSRMYFYKNLPFLNIQQDLQKNLQNTLQNNLNKENNNLNDKIKVKKLILLSPLHERLIQNNNFYLNYIVNWKNKGFVNNLFSFHGMMEIFLKFPNYSLNKELLNPLVESYKLLYEENLKNHNLEFKNLENKNLQEFKDEKELYGRLHYHARNYHMWKTIKNELNLYKRSSIQLNDCRKRLSSDSVTIGMEEEDDDKKVEKKNELDENFNKEEKLKEMKETDIFVLESNHQDDYKLNRLGIQQSMNNELLNDLINGFSNQSKIIHLNNTNHLSILFNNQTLNYIKQFINE